jgi:hypothetical protein
MVNYLIDNRIQSTRHPIPATISNCVRRAKVRGGAEWRGMIPIFSYGSQASEQRNSNQGYLSSALSSNYHLESFGGGTPDSYRAPSTHCDFSEKTTGAVCADCSSFRFANKHHVPTKRRLIAFRSGNHLLRRHSLFQTARWEKKALLENLRMPSSKVIAARIACADVADFVIKAEENRVSFGKIAGAYN